MMWENKIMIVIFIVYLTVLVLSYAYEEVVVQKVDDACRKGGWGKAVWDNPWTYHCFKEIKVFEVPILELVEVAE